LLAGDTKQFEKVSILSSRNIRLPFYIMAILVVTTGLVFLLKGTKSLEPVQGMEQVSTVLPGDPLANIPPLQDFVQFMDRELDSSNTVGAAYTVVYGGEIRYTGTYGVRIRGENTPVNDSTLFRMASVSKGFAGALACLLELEGILSLDERVIDHYPGFRLRDSVNTVDLTIRHLLSHTSGLVPFAFDNLVEAGEDLASIVDRLHEVDISAPPGELYGYQNVLFSMFDPVVNHIAGIPYSTLLDEKIFGPLGMKHASAGPVPQEKMANMAFPHVRTHNGYIPLNPHDGYYNVMPAAGVNASITDMERWLLALMGNMPEQLPDTVRTMLATPVIYTPLKARYTRYWQRFRERYYSLGWRVYRYRGCTIVYHGGYIQGYRAEIGLCPEQNTGIAFMSNSPNGLASRCVPAFFDRIIDFVEVERAVKEVIDSAPGRVNVAR
jgi:beta-lactamase class C